MTRREELMEELRILHQRMGRLDRFNNCELSRMEVYRQEIWRVERQIHLIDGRDPYYLVTPSRILCRELSSKSLSQ